MRCFSLKYLDFARTLAGVILLLMFQSCALFKPAPVRNGQAGASPFFDKVTIVLDGNHVKAGDLEVSNTSLASADQVRENYIAGLQGIEYLPPILFRYAILMDVEVERLANRKLFEYINQWWGVPYRIGGTTMTGIDCSAFVKGLTGTAFGIDLPRTSREQADYCREVQREELQEGDLVFFNTSGGISHVGMYLSNNKFVHASTSMGVVISDLNEPYWAKRYVRAGRILSE